MRLYRINKAFCGAVLHTILLLSTIARCQHTTSSQHTTTPNSANTIELEAILPPYETAEENEYLCTAIKLPDKPMKLVSVESLSEQKVVHHMLLFGCTTPAEDTPVWPCKMAPSCGDGSENVLYGWGKNAPPVQLPDDVGFSVGPGTGIRSVVLQVHYLKKRPPGDTSGVKLRLTPEPVPYSAGLVAFASGFEIPPKKKETIVPNECCYSGFEPLHGFAFRVHTHALGREVALYKQSPVENPNHQASNRLQIAPTFQKIVAQDPQLPQGFYPIEESINLSKEPLTIYPGDKLKATCNFDSTSQNNTVYAGHTHLDEMCNLYLMLYSEVPFFMWCVDGHEYIHAGGAGGLPNDGKAEKETTVWQLAQQFEQVALSTLSEKEKLQPMPLGQVSGIVAGQQDTNSLWLFHRATRTWTMNSFESDGTFTKGAIRWPAILQIDRDSGKLLNYWGEGMFYMPHMVSVGPNGSLWVVDAGLHQVMKFSAEGEKLLEIGRRLEPGNEVSPSVQFCQPTHAVVARDGTIYVADGYCNGRIVVLDGSGAFLTAYELPSENGKPLPLPHSIALDECRRRLYIADREVGKIRVLNLDTEKFDGEWDIAEHYGLPYAVRIGPYGSPLVLAWNRDGGDTTKLVSLDFYPGHFEGSWELPGVRSPHDLAVVPAPLAATMRAPRNAFYASP